MLCHWSWEDGSMSNEIINLIRESIHRSIAERAFLNVKPLSKVRRVCSIVASQDSKGADAAFIMLTLTLNVR
jgi:hypothetical protein